MQLLLKNGDHQRLVDWGVYALLRDNVEYYLEQGQHRRSFQALHAFERAVDGVAQRVNAPALGREVAEAWSALENVTLGQSAVSLRTRAIMTGCREAPRVRGTVLAHVAGWDLPIQGQDGQPLRELLSDFVSVLLWLTQCGPEHELLIVRA